MIIILLAVGFTIGGSSVPGAMIRGPGGRIITNTIRHRGTLYVPMAAVQRAYLLRYIDREGETFIFDSPRLSLRITPGEKEIRINGEEDEMDTPADWRDGKLIVPIYLAIQTLRKLVPVSGPVIPEPITGKVRIVLDPGHGGLDSGAIGRGGLQEKEVVLEIGRKVRDLLEIRGYDALLTRDEDRFISLKNRAGRANRYRADLFVSIHANAAYNQQARGTETFYYSPAAGRWGERIARIENAVLRLEADITSNPIAGSGKEPETGRLSESRRLARKIQIRIDPLSDGPDRGVKAADLYVLKYTRMPAVLVETGFLSNQKDRDLLADCAFRESMAEAIAAGISDFIDASGSEDASPVL